MKERTRKILYYILLIFGIFYIVGTIIDIFRGATLTETASGFFIGFIFLFVSKRFKPKSKDVDMILKNE